MTSRIKIRSVRIRGCRLKVPPELSIIDEKHISKERMKDFDRAVNEFSKYWKDHPEALEERKVEIERVYPIPADEEKYKELLKRLPEGAIPLTSRNISQPKLFELIHALGFLPLGYKEKGGVLRIYVSFSDQIAAFGKPKPGHVRKSLFYVNDVIIKSAHYVSFRLNLPLHQLLKESKMLKSVEDEYRMNMEAWRRGVRILKPLGILVDVNSRDEWLVEHLGEELERRFMALIKDYASGDKEAWERIVRYTKSAYVVALTYEVCGFVSPDLKGRNLIIFRDLFGSETVAATDVFPRKEDKPYPNMVLSDLKNAVIGMDVEDGVRERVIAEIERWERMLKKRRK